MALIKPRDYKLYKDEKGVLQVETDKQYDKRIKLEKFNEYENQISIIMKEGFTRKQAEYIYRMKEEIYSSIRHINAVY